MRIPLLAAFLALALTTAPAARAQSPDDSFPFSTGEAPAQMVPLDMPYTPRIEVWFPASLDDGHVARLVGILAAHLQNLPPVHRAVLKEVVFDPGAFPLAQRKARELHRSEFKAAGIALPNAMVFYKNPPSPDWHVTRSVVIHEMGHCFAMARFGGARPPAAWTTAAIADGNAMSSYADDSFKASGNYTEDFAESYQAFFEARIRGGDVPGKLQALYPHRVRLLETYTY